MASKRPACDSYGEWGEKAARKSISLAPGRVPFRHVTLKHRRTTLERVEKFLSPIYFADTNLFGRLFSKQVPVKAIEHYGPSEARFEDISKSKNSFKGFEIGKSFGPTFTRHWFKLDIEIPELWIGEKIQLLWDSGCEGMVWKNGEPVFSLTAVEENGLKKGYTIAEKLTNSDEKRFTLMISVSCNRLLGEGKDGMINPPNMEKMFNVSKCEITTVNVNAYEAFLDLQVLYNMTKSLPEDSQRGMESLYVSNEIVNSLVKENFSEQGYVNARNIAEEFFGTKNRQGQHVVHAMGHCHIDSAWLWRYSETVHKCARSWLSTISLMDKYPDFVFTCSQAQQFEWVKDNYPQIYERLKHYVKEGRFIPVGGTWVEMDGNLPSGEAMVRQFVYGQQFFREEFGKTCKEFWLPDTFGYSGNLPQIMNEAGIENFLTQKLSWNLVNTFPHNTFHWRGINGSSVLCHFPPGDSYGMMATPEELLKTINNHKDKGRSDVSAYLFGHGDGGGGPTEDMLRQLSRMTDCAGLPKVKMSSPDHFFAEIHKNSEKLCTWDGELYLEIHNGTYTTLAKIKKYNRKCEVLLHDVEFIYTLLGIYNSDVRYPGEELDRLWKLLLLNQFHDILPGSSIELVHIDALKYYDEIVEFGEKLINSAMEKLLKASKKKKDVYSAVNTLSWERKEVVELPDKSFVSINCPGLSIEGIQMSTPTPVLVEKLPKGVISLSNEHLKCSFDEGGRLISLKMCKGDNAKELVKLSTFGNQMIMFDDVPLFWDAWDVMDYHLETRAPVLEVIEPLRVCDKSCDLRASLEFSLRIGENSKLRQTIELDAGSPVVRFKTFVDWRENHKFLKVEFPWNIHSPKATYEIQFGHLERPTHQNTSWDTARYEVWAHKWADLSEYNCGVALLNDCKYGYSTFGSTMRLSLLRSPKAPDGNADMGEHEFTYAMLPHTGTFQDAGVIQQAYQLNNPLRIVKGSTQTTFRSFVQLNTNAVILDTCKQSDMHEGSTLIRLYEAFGGSSKAEITFPRLKIERVEKCNILEDINESLSVEVKESHTFCASFSPFQIQSFLVWLA